MFFPPSLQEGANEEFLHADDVQVKDEPGVDGVGAGAGGAGGAGGVVDGTDAGKRVDPSKRITTRYMTKYEKARILGTRALQLRYVVYFVQQ